jgi:small subunit ribosomal protein S29
MPKVMKPSAKSSVKGEKKFQMAKKKTAVKTGKPPAPGERKAMRKRIVLSNTNALQVEGLHDLSKDMEMAIHTGKVVGLPGQVVDSLRAVEAFKVTQGWGMFRRPALLIREESVFLSDHMKQAEEQKVGLRLVIDGERGTGKSLMLLHAMATAFVRGWIVVNIPEGNTSLSPYPSSKTDMFLQHKILPTLSPSTRLSQIRTLHFIPKTHTPQTGSPRFSNPTMKSFNPSK